MMSEEQRTNRYAFPSHDYNSGMTLLDWFAGHALAGLLALPDWYSDNSNGFISRACFDIAEEMLAESNRRNGR